MTLSSTARPAISSALQEPTAFRRLMVFAGLYYLWDAGSLFGYGSTIAFHNFESIRLINSWLADDDARISARCLRLMLTLCIAEVRPPALKGGDLNPKSEREREM